MSAHHSPAGPPLPEEWGRTATTVVMPTYNEADNLPAMAEALMSLPLEGLRLLVVDDNSPDGTGKIAEDLAERHNTPDRTRVAVLHRTAKDGLGRAYAAGMTRAVDEGAAYVLQMDADGSHPAGKVAELLGVALATGADVVVGSRYVPGGTLSDAWSAHRRLLSRWANAYASTILGTRVRDITSGFNLWSADALRAIDLDTVGSAGYSFQVEMKYRALRAGQSVLEVPIHFEDRTVGESKMNLAVQLESVAMPWRLRARAARASGHRAR
ncbi:polyprenol monophosphomannose synthase [Streptomyces albireticuli]|uniref:Polyprenol monophosphomannose synthase n=1 Tax=Streptomyces albireticuli TaxID=1940 RepID=A0A2A2DD64_9ACTN|nr:polyprenol monophosphomannose synthase [Streptomyces albireticuli]MCD9145840.1 polyprenol monophosphomannose synthase [Streptomyces albireticuli]MCD9165970.1 polyprenol monophosphomannose synthase [Streptomyces albireticuli]MCD9196158.1 polyprenol monophosphomannose synthase [Streptomyces albireticuli]PAU49464.1 polyprenol monophosphomannose synthase [Streptomyces albireticuli]